MIEAFASPQSAADGRTHLGTWARRVLGIVLVLLSVTPVYRLLDPAENGFAGEFTVYLADIHFDYIWSGLFLLALVAVGAALIAARYAPNGPEPFLHRAGAALARIPILHFAAGVALLGAVLTAVIALVVFEGRPNLIDSVAQLLHARYWADGRIAGPLTDDGGFRAIQNSIFTKHGWVSQYPPGHVLILAFFLRLGAPWLVGPALVGIAVFFAALTVARLLPERPATARFAALLVALSPFFLAISASYMNHATTAACMCMAAYALVRAWHGSAMWALFAGAACGYSLMTRPLSTLAMSAALALSIPFTVERVALRRFLLVNGFAALAAIPFVAALLLYNRHFFDSATTFGYDVALGPQMGLGFHRDPWGNLYTFREAIAYTSSDLTALGVNLLETPLSAVLVIGVFLACVRRLAAGERVLVAWALAPVATNFLYWHHGIFMGPRMLHEAAPAWALLFGVAAVRVIDTVPRERVIAGLSPRSGLTAMFAIALPLATLLLAPERVASYGGTWMSFMRTPVPAVDRPALVFVHDGWSSRLVMTLASHGYRLDIIETLMRQNPTCRMHPFVEAVRTGDTVTMRTLFAKLDTVPRASRLPPVVETSPGNNIRAWPGDSLDSECMRQVRSDSTGIVDIAPLLWLTDLPGALPVRALIARDLGPERNATLIARYPDRTPYVYMLPAPDAETPVLLPYGEGMRRLWSTTP